MAFYLFFKFNFISPIIIYNQFLFFYLYNLVKKENSSEHCNWRCCRCITSSNRMDNCNRRNFFRTNNIVFIIFFLTPSHFWALSLYKAGDYKKAKIPMLPVIAGYSKNKIKYLVYSLAMFPIVIAPYYFNFYWHLLFYNYFFNDIILYISML